MNEQQNSADRVYYQYEVECQQQQLWKTRHYRSQENLIKKLKHTYFPEGDQDASLHTCSILLML